MRLSIRPAIRVSCSHRKPGTTTRSFPTGLFSKTAPTGMPRNGKPHGPMSSITGSAWSRNGASRLPCPGHRRRVSIAPCPVHRIPITALWPVVEFNTVMRAFSISDDQVGTEAHAYQWDVRAWPLTPLTGNTLIALIGGSLAVSLGLAALGCRYWCWRRQFASPPACTRCGDPRWSEWIYCPRCAAQLPPVPADDSFAVPTFPINA